jgi:hypothetical protein
MRRRRRHVKVPPDLTSLFDVLFIVIFAVMIRGAALQQAAAKAAEPPRPGPPPPPQPATALKTKALAQLDAELAARPTVIARVTRAGQLVGIETADKKQTLDLPLLEHSPDPDIAIAYLGDRSAELRVCRLVALHLRIADLADHLVIIAPDARGADLPHALYTGLRRDVERCQLEQRGLAVIVEPDAAAQGSATP